MAQITNKQIIYPLSGSFTGSLFGTASFAQTASFALNSNIGSFATTASLNSYTASLNAFSASILLYTASLNLSLNTGSLATTASLNSFTSSINAFSASILTYTSSLNAATSSFVRNSQTSSMSVASASFAENARSASYALTASFALNAGGSTIDTGSFATTGSNTFKGNQTITGSINLTGSILTNPDLPIQISSTTQVGSLVFEGTSSLAMSPGIIVGSGSYTAESFIYINDYNNRNVIFAATTPGGAGFSFGTLSVNQIFTDRDGVSANVYEFASNFPTNQWFHVAVTRNSGGQETVFVSGVKSTSAYGTNVNYSGITDAIGKFNEGVWIIRGRVSQARLVVGSNVYDPTSSTITVPTSSLTNITNTKVLLNVTSAGTYLNDTSGNQTITNSGSVTFNSSGPVSSSLSTVESLFKSNGDLTIPGNVIAGGAVSASAFTGSLFGTASYANNAQTASYVNPLRQDIIITGSLKVSGSLTEIGDTVLTGSLTLSSGSALRINNGFYVNGNQQFNYGQFSSTQTQTGSANTAYSATFNTTDFSQGVSLVSGSRITISNTGLYNVQFSAQLHTTSNQAVDFSIWFAMTGSDIANSNTDFSIEKINGGGFQVAALNFLIQITSGSYVELKFSKTTTNGQLQAKGTQSTPTRPATPSVILTVTQVV